MSPIIITLNVTLKITEQMSLYKATYNKKVWPVNKRINKQIIYIYIIVMY